MKGNTPNSQISQTQQLEARRRQPDKKETGEKTTVSTALDLGPAPDSL